MSAAQVTWDNPAPQVKWDDEQPKPTAAGSPEQPGFLNTLGRETSSLGKTILGIPSGIVHAFSDEPTPEEQEYFRGDTKGPKRVGLGIARMTTEPVRHAADWYKDAVQGKIADPYENALSVAPEAMGIGAAAPLAQKIGEMAPGAIKSTIENVPKIGKTASAIAKPIAKMGVDVAQELPVVGGPIKAVARGAKAFGDASKQVGDIWRKPTVDSLPGIETPAVSEIPAPQTTPDWLTKVGEKVDRTARPSTLNRSSAAPDQAQRPSIWSYQDNLEDSGIKQSMETDLNKQGALGRREERAANTLEAKPKWLRMAEFQAQQSAEKIMAEAQVKATTPKRFTKTDSAPVASPNDDLTGLLEDSIRLARKKKP